MPGKTTDSQKIENQKGDTPAPYTIKSNLAIVQKSAEESCPFRELIHEWLGCCRSDGLSKRTIADYQDKAFKFWWWWDKHYAAELGMHPKNVSTKEARAFAAYLREPVVFRWGITKPTNNKFKQSQNLSPASVAGYGRAIKVFFNWLEREDYIVRSPFNKSVKFTNRNKQDRVIKSVSIEDINLIFATLTESERLNTFDGCRNLAMIALLLDSGMRRGELLSMRLRDIELDKGRCQIVGKTGRRTGNFTTGVLEALSLYLGKYRSIQDQDVNSALWLTEDGYPLSNAGFGSVIRRIEIRSGVDFHAHKLRHTFATMMAAQGVNVFDLKEMLGHQSITTTQIYVQQNPERLAQIHKAASPVTSIIRENGERGLIPGFKRRRGRPRKEL